MEERIITDGTVTNEQMEAFFSKNERILRFVYLSKVDNEGQITEHVFPSGTAKEQWHTQPYISYPFLMEANSSKWETKIGLNREALFSPIPKVVLLLAMTSFAVYWILFGWWNTMNAYRMNRLNIVWAVMFFTLNIFAYLLFRLDENIKMRRLKLTA